MNITRTNKAFLEKVRGGLSCVAEYIWCPPDSASARLIIGTSSPYSVTGAPAENEDCSARLWAATTFASRLACPNAELVISDNGIPELASGVKTRDWWFVTRSNGLALLLLIAVLSVVQTAASVSSSSSKSAGSSSATNVRDGRRLSASSLRSDEASCQQA